MSNIIDKNALVKKMDERQAALLKLVERDITGNTLAVLEAWRECKYWKEAIIRGEFDPQLWED